jgi:hypothetical protein
MKYSSPQSILSTCFANSRDTISIRPAAKQALCSGTLAAESKALQGLGAE